MKKEKHLRYWSLLLFFYLSIALLIAISIQNWHLFHNKDAVMFTYLENVKEGKVGYGLNAVYNNGILFEGLEEGDIVLGGYPACAYGRFSHAGIYIGNNRVMEAYVDLGVNTQTITHYGEYTEVCLLRVEINPEIKKKAVEYVRNFEGGVFFPLAFKPGERIWNCSKIIWKAYAEQGVNLDPANDIWIAPEAFYYSPYVKIISEKGR